MKFSSQMTTEELDPDGRNSRFLKIGVSVVVFKRLTENDLKKVRGFFLCSESLLRHLRIDEPMGEVGVG